MARIKAKQCIADYLGIDVSEVKTSNPEVSSQLHTWVMDSIVPACCDEGCEVEPDGKCEHGCPSVLIALGLI